MNWTRSELQMSGSTCISWITQHDESLWQVLLMRHALPNHQTPLQLELRQFTPFQIKRKSLGAWEDINDPACARLVEQVLTNLHAYAVSVLL